MNRAGLNIISRNAVIRQLETKFASTGLSNALSRETVTGAHRLEAQSEPTDRGKRESTEVETKCREESDNGSDDDNNDHKDDDKDNDNDVQQLVEQGFVNN